MKRPTRAAERLEHANIARCCRQLVPCWPSVDRNKNVPTGIPTGGGPKPQLGDGGVT